MNHNLHTGEVWVCHEPCCEAIIEVRRGAKQECPGDFVVRCCCGKEMALQKAAEPKKTTVASARTA